MAIGDHFHEREEQPGESPEPETSFHGWLLDRSKTDLPDYTGREKLTWLAEQWGSLGPVVGVGALVLGGLAIGAGALLAGDGGISTNRSILPILAGVGCLFVGGLVLLAQWLITRWSTEDVQG